MRSGSAPAWARSLALAVCAEAGMAPPDVLRWRRADRVASSGVASSPRRSIAVTAGTDEADARHTLLHELAHWLTPDSPRRGRGRGARTTHHGPAFYAVALGLYASREDGLLNALRREASRYPSALRHAARLGVNEAEIAVLSAERRLARTAAGTRRSAWRLLVPEHAVRLRRDGRWWVCATCGRRMVGRVLLRAARRGRRERHALWTREPLEPLESPEPLEAAASA